MDSIQSTIFNGTVNYPFIDESNNFFDVIFPTCSFRQHEKIFPPEHDFFVTFFQFPDSFASV